MIVKQDAANRRRAPHKVRSLVRAPRPTYVLAPIDDAELSADTLFESLDRIRAIPSQAIAPYTGFRMRAYPREDLYSVAELARRYLLSGGLRLAEVLFEGLVAVAPDEAYFWTCLGLAHDHLDRRQRARECYEFAQRLAPKDPRPLINLAELALADRAIDHALTLFARALDLAREQGDTVLVRKASALLEHTRRRGSL